MKRTTSTILGLLAGFAAGYAVGVLFAPDEGKVTRKKLLYQLSKYKNELQALAEKLTVEAKAQPQNEALRESNKVVDELREQATDLLRDFEALKREISLQRKN